MPDSLLWDSGTGSDDVQFSAAQKAILFGSQGWDPPTGEWISRL